MARPTMWFRSAVIPAFIMLATLAGTGCGGDPADDAVVDRSSAALLPTLVVVNGLSFDVSLMPGIGTAADARVALQGESIRAIGEVGACVGVARNGDVTRIAMLVDRDRMTVGTPAKCTDAGLGAVTVTWRADELSGTRRLDTVLPGTQWCVERQGLLEVQARIEPVGTAC